MTPYQILQAACEKILQSRSSRPDEIARDALDAAAKARLADDDAIDTARREGWEEGILWMRDKTMVALNNDVAIDLDVIANELIEMGPVK